MPTFRQPRPDNLRLYEDIALIQNDYLSSAIETTGATLTTMFDYVLTDDTLDQLYYVESMVMAIEVATGKILVSREECAFSFIGGVWVQGTEQNTYIYNEFSTAYTMLTKGTSPAFIRVRVGGEAGITIQWKCELRLKKIIIETTLP